MICTKIMKFFEKKILKAFSLWRSCMLKERLNDKDLLLEKLKEEVVDSHSRENEIVSLLQIERRRAQEEQGKLHEAVRNAENEKKEAIVKAEEEISDALHKQLEIVNNAVNNKMISASTSTSKSIEIASLRQSYQEKEMQLKMQLQLERQQQEAQLLQQEILDKQRKQEQKEMATAIKQNDTIKSNNKLKEILPEDLLRNSNEEMLLSHAMNRIRRSSISKISKEEIQSSLAKEIKEKF